MAAQGGKDGLPRLKAVRTKGGPSPDPAEPEPPVSPTSRLFLHPKFLVVIACSLEFRDRMDLSRLRTHLKGTLGRHPRFRSKVVYRDRLGAPAVRWVPVEVEIEQHVFEASLTDEERSHPETAVESYTARMLGAPRFDPERPQWQAHLIHVARPRSASSCVFLLQHSMGDGMSLMSLLLATTRQTDNLDLLPTLPGARAKLSATTLPRTSSAAVAAEENAGGAAAAASAGEPAAGVPAGELAGSGMPKAHMPSEASSETLDSMAASSAELAEHWAHGHSKNADTAAAEAGREEAHSAAARSRVGFLELAKNSLVEITRFNAKVLAAGDHRNALKAHNSTHYKARLVAFSEEIPLSDISAIRKAAGGTVNDVMLAALTLAIEKYLSLGQGAGEKPQVRLPRRPRLSALCLVNLRQAPGLQEFSAMMDESRGARCPWGNKLGVFVLPLPVMRNGFTPSLPPDQQQPKEHVLGTLKSITKMCNAKKKSLEAPYSYVAGRAAMALGGTWAAYLTMKRLACQTTLSVSNMLGPLEQISMAGNPITAISPTAPPPYHAFMCHFQAYNGRIKAVLLSSKDNCPDLPALAKLVLVAFRELHQHAVQEKVLP